MPVSRMCHFKKKVNSIIGIIVCLANSCYQKKKLPTQVVCVVVQSPHQGLEIHHWDPHRIIWFIYCTLTLNHIVEGLF